MTHCILIGSYAGSPWLQECVSSLPKDILTIVVCEPGYECGKIGWLYSHTDIQEFLFLPDTVVVKTHEWIRRMFETRGSVSVGIEPGRFGSFMGKYRRETLAKVGVPRTSDKRSAVAAEAVWCRQYCEAESIPEIPVLFPDFQHGPSPARIEMKHGRLNAVVENDHLIKWKGTWNVPMIAATEKRDRELAGRVE